VHKYGVAPGLGFREEQRPSLVGARGLMCRVRSAIKREESGFAPVRLQRNGRGPAMPPRYSSDGPAAPRKVSD